MDLKDGRVITNFIQQIINNRDLIIYGNGEQTRSFCYVDDMIDGLIKMMDNNESGPINLGNPNCEFTLNQLVLLFEEIIGYKLNVIHINSTENDPKQRKPNIKKANQRLGFDPKVDIVEGLKRTIMFFIQ
jgi:UDP-glucuronate decarboxylase